MEKYILGIIVFITLTNSALSMGYRHLRSPLGSMSESIATINQVTEPTNSEGKQRKQWDREEENMKMTDDEKEEIQKQQEELWMKQESTIEDYRFDVGPKRN